MANVTATATKTATLTASPSAASSQYHLSGSLSATITPAPAAIVWFYTHVVSGVRLAAVASRAAWPSYVDENGQKQVATIAEAMESRDFKQTPTLSSYERVFYIHGTYDTTKCRDLGPQPGSVDDVVPSMVLLDRTMTAYSKGGGYSDIVKVVCKYSEVENPKSSGADSQATFTYEFTSESDHVDVATAQTNYTPVGETIPPSEALLINFTGQEINGVDITSPVLEFTEEHAFPMQADPSSYLAFGLLTTKPVFTAEYRRTLRDSVGSVNSAVFREYAIGEVIFVGASAQKRLTTWYVVFKFRVRKNITADPVTIYNKAGGTETVSVSKRGWQYRWIGSRNIPYLDGVEQKTRIGPTSVHVADVYDYIDFAVLGIGTASLT